MESIFPQRLILWPIGDLNSELPVLFVWRFPTALSNHLKQLYQHNIMFLSSFNLIVKLMTFNINQLNCYTFYS